MSKRTAAAAASTPTVAPDAPVADSTPVEDAPEVVAPVEYVPSDDDGLTSIDDVKSIDDTEVDPDDDEWGYAKLGNDVEVSSPEAIAAAEAEIAEEVKTDD